jgi:hypothetical protein
LGISAVVVGEKGGKGEGDVWMALNTDRVQWGYQSARRGDGSDKIGNGENFRGVAQFYSGDSAVNQSCALPSFATNKAQCGRQGCAKRGRLLHKATEAIHLNNHLQI